MTTNVNRVLAIGTLALSALAFGACGGATGGHTARPAVTTTTTVDEPNVTAYALICDGLRQGLPGSYVTGTAIVHGLTPDDANAYVTRATSDPACQ